MRGRAWTRAMGAAGALAGATGLLACSSSGDSGVAVGALGDASGDQTAGDATGGAAEADAAPGDALAEAVADAGPSPESGADAGPDAPPEAGDSGPTCTPVDAAIDGAAAATGMTIVQNYFCLDCHGTDLGGNIPVGGAYSKNLTPDPATGLGCWTDSQIVTAMLYGTTPDGETLCVMPKWGTTGYSHMTLDAGQAEQIVQYLRSIPAVSRVVPPTDCVALGYGPDAGADGGDASARDSAADSADAPSE